MPNWCRNELRIVPSDWMCKEPEIEEFLEALRETIDNYRDRLKRWYESDRKNKSNHYWLSEHKRGLFDFNNFIPYPKEFKERDQDYATLSPEDFKAKYPKNTETGFAARLDKDRFKAAAPLDGYNNGGYEWCIQNWGTKWSASEVVWVPEHMTLYFMTAWGPTFPIISEIHKRFPHFTLNYEYYERGMGFMGGCEYVPEEWWNADRGDYIPMGKDHEIEMAMKKDGKPPEFKWEAGQAYNFWEADYKGYKGG